MKRAELHRLISEAMEGYLPSTTNLLPTDWKWHGIGHSYAGTGLNIFTPIPLDYSMSEDASAKLLDAMRAGGPDGMRTSHFRRLLEELLFGDADRKTAVLLAAAKWKGIEVGDLED